MPGLSDDEGWKWKPYQERQATEAELRQWFTGPNGERRGIGIVHGQVSGNSEVLDIEEGAVAEYLALCADHGLSEMVARCARVETPSGGLHLYYRREGEPEGNQKLAWRPVPVPAEQADALTPEERKRQGIREDGGGGYLKVETKIETRGEGGFTVAPGSPPNCHPSGYIYRMAAGSPRLDAVPVLTNEDRSALLAMARACNEWADPSESHRPPRETRFTSGTGFAAEEQKAAPPPQRAASADVKAPGDDYNERVTTAEVLDMLTSEGWQIAGYRGDTVDLTRPGKNPREGISGTLGAVAPNVFYCFTSAAPPFEPNRAYPPFSVYGLLKHGGDFHEAARDLGELGYGTPATMPLNVDGVPARRRRRTKAASGQAAEDYNAGDEAEPAEAVLPVVVTTNRPDRVISAESWAAVLDVNDPPRLFSQGKGIARIIRDEETKEATIESLDEEGMLFRLRRVADYVSLRKLQDGGYQQTHVPPPLRIARDMLRDADRIAGLPPLHSICYIPVVGAKGELITTPGYHREIAVYLATERLGECLPLGDTPEAAADAFDRLFGAKNGVFGEFPFAADADRAHAASLLFALFLRPYINGCAPLYIVEAPEAGTGKSLLLRNILRVADVAPKPWDSPAARERDTEAEWNKVLATALQHNPPTLFLDNVRGIFASTALEGILTSPDPTALRLLGTSKEVRVFPTLLTIAATSNNAEANRDIVRRSVSIRIDAKMSRPESRGNWRVADLDDYVKSHRREIAVDVLTILAAWIKAGRPEQNERVKGSFERWARIVGGVLDFLGVPGFLENEIERAQLMDPHTEQWGGFLEAWAKAGCDYTDRDGHELSLPALGEGWVSAGGVLSLAIAKQIVAHHANSKTLGHLLGKNRDRVFNGYRLEMKFDTDAKTNKYRAVGPPGGLFTGMPGIYGDSHHDTRDPFSEGDKTVDTGSKRVHRVDVPKPVNPRHPRNPVSDSAPPPRPKEPAEMERIQETEFGENQEEAGFRYALSWTQFHLGGKLWEFVATAETPWGRGVGKGADKIEAVSALCRLLDEKTFLPTQPPIERMRMRDFLTVETNQLRAEGGNGNGKA